MEHTEIFASHFGSLHMTRAGFEITTSKNRTLVVFSHNVALAESDVMENNRHCIVLARSGCHDREIFEVIDAFAWHSSQLLQSCRGTHGIIVDKQPATES